MGTTIQTTLIYLWGRTLSFRKKEEGGGDYRVTRRTFPEIMLVGRFPEIFQTIPTWGKLFPPGSGLFIGA